MWNTSVLKSSASVHHLYFDLRISGDDADPVQNSAVTLLLDQFDLDDAWTVAAYCREALAAVAAVETNKYAQRTTARCNVIALSHFYCTTELVMGWVHPWVELGWVGLGQSFLIFGGLGWVGWRLDCVIFSTS